MRKNFENRLNFLPLPVLVIGTFDENGVPNAMNAAWGAQCDFDKITICLSPHKTTENFAKTGAFSVAFATRETEVQADFFGIASGRNQNKIEKAGFHFEKSKFVNAPVFLELPLTLECEVVSFENEMLVGKVKNMSVDEKFLDENGNPDIDKMHIICYDSTDRSYRLLGERVGKAFSDGKKL